MLSQSPKNIIVKQSPLSQSPKNMKVRTPVFWTFLSNSPA
jgi:hypothetical protein